TEHFFTVGVGRCRVHVVDAQLDRAADGLPAVLEARPERRREQRAQTQLAHFESGLAEQALAHGWTSLSFHNLNQSVTALSPAAVSTPVCMVRWVMWKRPGQRPCQGRLAAGQYWRAYDSMAATPGTCAARPAEWISEAPGQVKSCTHRNMPYF